MSRSESSSHRVTPYRRPIIVGGFLLVLVVVVVVTILVFKNIDSSKDHVGADQTNPSIDQPVTEPEQPSTDPDDVENKTPQYEGEDPNDLPELTGVIVYKDIDRETLTLHSAVSINQYLQGDGQCVFNLKKDEAIIRTTSAIATPDVTTSACGPIDISVEGLSGIYQIEVIMTGDGKHGIITSEIQI